MLYAGGERAPAGRAGLADLTAGLLTVVRPAATEFFPGFVGRAW